MICASHFIEYDGQLCNVHDIANARPHDKENMLRHYWDKIGRAAGTGMFNWMAHLDLPKKTACGREECWVHAEQFAMNAIAKSKTPIEINTSFYERSHSEPYPSPRILKMAARDNVPVLLSDDAHCAEHIGRHFIQAYDLAVSCGVHNFMTAADAIKSR